MDDYIGMIKIFAGNFAPRGWAFCNGTVLQIRQYTAVYAIIGTNFGGDGQTTFKLPNLNGSVLVGAGTSTTGTTYAVGKTGGSETVQMTLGNMPTHNHPITGSVAMMCNGDHSEGTDPAGNFYAPCDGNAYNGSADPACDMGALTNTLGIGITGNGTPYDNRQPFMAVNYIICLEGDFPPRN